MRKVVQEIHLPSSYLFCLRLVLHIDLIQGRMKDEKAL